MDDPILVFLIVAGVILLMALGFIAGHSSIRQDCLIKKEFKVDGVLFTCQLKEQQTK